MSIEQNPTSPPIGPRLDDRRPRFLKDLVGNEHVKLRLREQMRRGRTPRRAFFFCPTGSGKTTSSRILAAHFFCDNRVGIGDPCGRCGPCQTPLESISDYAEWPGEWAEAHWHWWAGNGQELLSREDTCVFLDEAQDLAERHQKWFLKQLESARATVIFATTHRHAINDALLARFGSNVFEMRRPTLHEVVSRLTQLFQELGIQAVEPQVRRIAQEFGCDMRKCTECVYTTAEQIGGSLLSDDYLNAVFGSMPRDAEKDESAGSRARL